MAQFTKIEWCDHTANLWHGCTEVHAGCDNCYARVLSERWNRDIWGNDKPRMAIKSVWNDLAKFQKLAAAEGVVKTVFVGSMMDIFEKPMPIIGGGGTWLIRNEFFRKIDMGLYPNLMFLLLTKRPSNIHKYIPFHWQEKAPDNVMYGTSPVDQETADKLIPQLLQVEGRKFLSCEPLLGPIDLSKWMDLYLGPSKIQWVIAGGESGHHARPVHPKWLRSLQYQCQVAGVPFLFKQWGEYASVSEVAGPGKHHQFPDGATVRRVGKKAAGNTLDGVQYLEFPPFKI